MKLIIRTDDVGYNYIHNLGTFKAVDEGLVTHLDIMLDCREGTNDALRFAKARPWLSTGWHPHLWGWPILPAEEVPSMVNEVGRIKGRKTFDPSGKQLSQMEIGNAKASGDTKKIINPERASIQYEDAVKECRAQMENCIAIYGKTLTFGGGFKGELGVERAIYDVGQQYKLVGPYMSFRNMPLDPVCAKANIQTVHVFKDYYNSDMKGGYFYDPYSVFKEAFTKDKVESDNIYMIVLHCGYVDEMIFRESSLSLGRIVDTEFACSKWLKDFVLENKVELINIEDAVFGSNNYQEHLKEINSPLWIGNMK